MELVILIVRSKSEMSISRFATKYMSSFHSTPIGGSKIATETSTFFSLELTMTTRRRYDYEIR